ncbi:MAG: TolB family protein [Burkholderiales bacterium]
MKKHQQWNLKWHLMLLSSFGNLLLRAYQSIQRLIFIKDMQGLRHCALERIKQNLVYCFTFFTLFLVVMTTMTNDVHAQPLTNQPKFELEKQGRYFMDFSIHPNGEEIMFTESHDLPDGSLSGSDIYQYNIRTHAYRRYVFKDDAAYSYSSPAYSPRGDRVIILRTPMVQHFDLKKGKALYAELENNFKKTQVLMMDHDGKNLQVLPIPLGEIVHIVFSPDGTKIAYSLNHAPLKENERNFGMMDMWEYNLVTGKNTLFAGPFSFVMGSIRQYLNNDQLLITARLATDPEHPNTYQGARFQHSEIMKLDRGTKKLPKTLYGNIADGAGEGLMVTMDKFGNTYLQGHHYVVPSGSYLYKITSDTPVEGVSAYAIPESLIHANLVQLTVDPDGRKAFFFYAALDADLVKDGAWKFAFGELDLKHQHWSNLTIPKREDSQAVQVQ